MRNIKLTPPKVSLNPPEYPPLKMGTLFPAESTDARVPPTLMTKWDTITLPRAQLDALIQEAVRKAMAQRDEDEEISRWSRPVEC